MVCSQSFQLVDLCTEYWIPEEYESKKGPLSSLTLERRNNFDTEYFVLNNNNCVRKDSIPQIPVFGLTKMVRDNIVERAIC